MIFGQKNADIRSSITNQICLPVVIKATSTVTAYFFSEFNLLSESEVFDHSLVYEVLSSWSYSNQASHWVRRCATASDYENN